MVIKQRFTNSKTKRSVQQAKMKLSAVTLFGKYGLLRISFTPKEEKKENHAKLNI